MAGSQHLFNAKFGRHHHPRVVSLDISGRETLMTASAVSHLAKSTYNFRGSAPLRTAGPPPPSTPAVPPPTAVPIHHRGSFLALLTLLHSDQRGGLADLVRHIRFVHHNLVTATCPGRDRRWSRGAPPQGDSSSFQIGAYAPRAIRFAGCSCHPQQDALSPASSTHTLRDDPLETSTLSTSGESKASEPSPARQSIGVSSCVAVDVVAIARAHVRDHVKSNRSRELRARVPRTGLLARSRVTWIAVHNGTDCAAGSIHCAQA